MQEISVPHNARASDTHTVGILLCILLLLFTHLHFADKDSLAKGRINKLRHILSLLHLCLSINCQRYRWKSTKACLKQLHKGQVRQQHQSLMLGKILSEMIPSWLCRMAWMKIKDTDKRRPANTVKNGLNCVRKQYLKTRPREEVSTVSRKVIELS